jgi:hypothetical protein
MLDYRRNMPFFPFKPLSSILAFANLRWLGVNRPLSPRSSWISLASLISPVSGQACEEAERTYLDNFRYEYLAKTSYDGCKVILDWLIK